MSRSGSDAGLSVAVARAVRAAGGNAALVDLACAATLADLEGHSALPLDGAWAQTVAALDGSALVGSAIDFDPRRHWFVRDGAQFFLARNWRDETAIAAQLRARLTAPATPQAPVSAQDLACLFGRVADFGDAEDAPDASQRRAVAACVGRRLVVLTGGPGTGKTRTVLGMLLAMGRDFARTHGRLPQIGLAAPTGKAARALQLAFDEQARALAPRLQEPAAVEFGELLGVAREANASTLHRLLGIHGAGAEPRHHAGAQLALDLLVVDEASMLDLGMMRALLAALPEHAQLVLVGDADQLHAVGSGSVLADLVSALESGRHPALFRLRHSFRASVELVALAGAVGRGEALPLAASAAFERIDPSAPGALDLWLAHWTCRVRSALGDAGVFEAADRDDAARLRCLAALKRRQLLCVLREGRFGAQTLSQHIDAALTDAAWQRQRHWFAGRAVMVTQNDGLSGLVNGDVGLCLVNAQQQFEVVFEGAGGVRVLHPQALPAHQSAFALTVHKSQGSEYDEVALVLPEQPDHPLLSRQLLYTALTRARQRFELLGRPEVIDAAIARPAGRASGLAARLGVG